MTGQTTLPGCAPTSTANRAALEQDLRGDTTLAIMALLTFAEFHGGRTALIDDTVEKFLTAGGSSDPSISRALVKLRSQLARYVAHGGPVPSWFPASLLAVIRDASWCEPELPRSSVPKVEATPDDENGENGFSHYR